MTFVESFRSTLLSWDPIGVSGDLEGTGSGVALDLVVIVLSVEDVSIIDIVVVVVGVFFVVVVVFVVGVFLVVVEVVEDTVVVGIISFLFGSKLKKFLYENMINWRDVFGQLRKPFWLEKPNLTVKPNSSIS